MTVLTSNMYGQKHWIIQVDLALDYTGQFSTGLYRSLHLFITGISLALDYTGQLVKVR